MVLMKCKRLHIMPKKNSLYNIITHISFYNQIYFKRNLFFIYNLYNTPILNMLKYNKFIFFFIKFDIIMNLCQNFINLINSLRNLLAIICKRLHHEAIHAYI